MMRRSAGFDADKARRQLLKEWYNVPALELTANDYITCRVNSVNLKNRLRDIETDCRDSLHIWLLQPWGLQQHPHPWHFRAGGGAVHSIRSGLMHRSKSVRKQLIGPSGTAQTRRIKRRQAPGRE